jgi:hypothetical protein
MQPRHLSDVAHGDGPGRAQSKLPAGIFERLALIVGLLCSSRNQTQAAIGGDIAHALALPFLSSGLVVTRGSEPGLGRLPRGLLTVLTVFS